jgi:hypothetical protein
MKLTDMLLLMLISLHSTNLVAEETLSLQDLKFLEGNWRLENPNQENKNFRLRYHFISRDSALVEVYGNPNKQTTETIIHADKTRLMATHYCAQGNQPRLVAKKIKNHQIQFELFDITNLVNQKDPHMVRMTFTSLDKTHFKKEEVYLANGKEELSTMNLIKAE